MIEGLESNMDCAKTKIASLGLWIAVTLTILITWIVAGANYSASEDSEVGRGSALFTLTHTAYLVVLQSSPSRLWRDLMRGAKCGTSPPAEEIITGFGVTAALTRLCRMCVPVGILITCRHINYRSAYY